VSWESHAAELDAIKERINKIGQTIQKLQNIARQRFPMATGGHRPHHSRCAKLASNTTAAIEHLNQSPKRLQDHNISSI